MGLNVALTHQNRSYSDNENKENIEAQKRNREGETTGRGPRQLKINTTKKEKKQIRPTLLNNLFPLYRPTQIGSGSIGR